MISSTNNVTYSSSPIPQIIDTSTEYLQASGLDVTALFKVVCEVRLHPDFRAAFTDVQKFKMDKVLNNLLDIMVDVTDTGGASPFNE